MKEKLSSGFQLSLDLQLIYTLYHTFQDMVSMMRNVPFHDREDLHSVNVIELVLQHIEPNNSFLKMASWLLQLTQSLLAQMKTLNSDKLLHQLFHLVLNPFLLH